MVRILQGVWPSKNIGIEEAFEAAAAKEAHASKMELMA
jgi:hypothetical protein